MAVGRGIRALTFDCYGTLVDWETGILRDLRAGLAPFQATDDEVLALYARAEAAAEAGEFRPYREVLRTVLTDVARGLGTEVVSPNALVAGLPTWPIFPDTTKALAALGLRHRLCVVSNVDRDLFLQTEERIGIRFDEVVTADDVRSYKPGPAHFEEALRRLALRPVEVAHVGQSRFHDVAPARALGMRTFWIDRRAGRPGGATRDADASIVPDHRLTSLAELAELLG